MTLSRSLPKHAWSAFVTGGTGFLGRWLLIELTRRGHPVLALVRNAAQRSAELRRFVDARGGDGARITVVDGDLTKDRLGLEDRAWTEVQAAAVVYHLGANFAFGLRPEQARSTNVEGTRRVLSLADALPGLRRFVLLGGYRTEHMPSWLAEAQLPLEEAARRRLYRAHGAYEASKYEAHRWVQTTAEATGMPLTIVNPCTVIGDSRTGETTQLTGLGETVQRLVEGKLPLLAGDPDTFVPVVTVDHVARMLATVPHDPQTIGQALAVLDTRTPMLLDLLAELGRLVGADVPRRRISPRLLRRLPQLVTGIEPEALTFLTNDRYDTASADAHARRTGIAMPELDRSLERWTTFLVASRFVQRPAPANRQLRTVAGSRAYAEGDPSTAEAVLLHGLPWDAESFRRVADHFRGTSARLDMPGLGRSGPIRASDEVAWLEDWLSSRSESGKHPLLLVGHSLGASLALRYAHRFPSRVDHLVLVAPAFLQPRPPRWMRTSWIVRQLFRHGDVQTMQRMVLETEGDLHPAVRSSYAQFRRAGGAARAADALARATRAEVRKELSSLLFELPPERVSIVVGEHDPMVEAIPLGIEVVTIPGAGHHLHVTHPRELAAVLDRLAGRRDLTPSLTEGTAA